MGFDLGCSTRNREWSRGERSTGARAAWTELGTRFVVPADVTGLQPRLIGHGSATVWLDDYSLLKAGSVTGLRAQGLPPKYSLTNRTLALTFDTALATLSATDRRTGRTNDQYAPDADFAVTSATATSNRIRLDLLQISTGAAIKADLALDPVLPEFVLPVSGSSELPAALRMRRHEDRLTIAPEWDPQRGQFGYTRKLRYVFLDQGGHVAIAKRYREHARQQGLFKTLADKRAENPNVDLLVGAVNVWNWDRETFKQVTANQAMEWLRQAASV